MSVLISKAERKGRRGRERGFLPSSAFLFYSNPQ